MQVMAQTVDADWRQPRAEDLLIMQLEAGRIIIELAPIFAPEHVNNILTLVNGGWFDGLSINRVQDNFVAQWGIPITANRWARPRSHWPESFPARVPKI